MVWSGSPATTAEKGRDLAAGPMRLSVFWHELEQALVRIGSAMGACAEPGVERLLSPAPLGSRIGAWASPQSRVLTSRDALESAWHRAPGSAWVMESSASSPFRVDTVYCLTIGNSGRRAGPYLHDRIVFPIAKLMAHLRVPQWPGPLYQAG